MIATRWTSVDDLLATLRKRWERGDLLRAYAAGKPWDPIVLSVRAPTATEVLDDLEGATRWSERFRRDSCTESGRPRFGVEHRTIKGNGLGSNDVPCRVRIDSFDQLCAVLGTRDDVRALDEILELTRSSASTLVGWVTDHPLEAVAHHAIWPDLVSTVRWVESHDTSRCYVRHIDVPGVDTKFVERHRKILGRLLLELLPAERVHIEKSGFAQRFGFRSKPQYVRLRILSPIQTFPPPITEIRLRVDEVAEIELPVATVFVIENEVSYLAFPEVNDSIAIFGEGFALTTLESITWLHGKEIVYWGDIDTHGFSILSRLRARFGSVRSILMDHETLLAHPTQLVEEDSPTDEVLGHLTTNEQTLYRDLIEDRYGRSVRLEQERVRFTHLRHALAPWTTSA